jgi:hypothetical protein
MPAPFGDQKTGRVQGLVISGTANDGLSVTVDGVPARLAVVTDDGKVLDSAEIAKEAFAVSVNCYRDFLRAQGHLRTLSKPIPYRASRRPPDKT